MKQYLELPTNDLEGVIAFSSAEWYLQDVSYEEDVRLAALHKVPVLTNLLQQKAENADAIRYLKYFTSYYSRQYHDIIYTKLLRKKLDRLAKEDTDADAVLIYAIRTALGFTDRKKDEAFDLLKKTAAMGSKAAKWELDENNRDNVCIWELNSAKSFCEAQHSKRR